MVAYLTKSDASEGFNQVINFLNGSYIKYALTVNPNIYVSCIKQFWNTVAVKQDNDVTRLQAQVDKKKVVVTEAAIRESISAKRTSWNEFSSAMASAVICLSTGDLSTHTTKYTSLSLTQKIFTNMRRVGKGFSGVEMPLFEGMPVGQEIKEGGDEDEHVEDVTAGDDAQVDDIAAHGEVPTISQEPSMPSPNPPTPPPQPHQDLPTTSHRIDTSDDTVMDDESNQGRIIDEMDKDDVVALMDDKEEDKKDEEAKVVENDQEDELAEVQEVVDVVTTAKLITEVVTAASEIVTGASTIISTAEPQVPAATITAAPTKVAAASSRRRKGVVIRDSKEESTTSSIISAETKSKDKGKGIMTEAQARMNMMMYLKNVAGLKLDYFKGMYYDDIRPVFEAMFNLNVDFLIKTKEQMEEEESRALQTINETPPEKAAKRRKLNEKVEDLKRHLEIMPDKDDDVYTEATLLARKVPVMDYEIIELNLEALWNLVKERFSTSKPKNFFDDFLLTTLGAMFKKPDALA
nr:hypothetical protein [Tanacetum cinerariifolium]